MRIWSLLSAVFWALPAYYLWNYLAPIYLPQLPAQYLELPFWNVAAAFVLLKIVGIVIFAHPRKHRHFHKLKKFGKSYCDGHLTETYYH
jgi:hypothetical protein